MAPKTMKALATGQRSYPAILLNGLTGKGISHGASVRDDIPVPQLDPDEILVKVQTVALNPTDWKHIDYISPPNSIIGCDYAGEVAELGTDVPVGAWKVGERVAGVAHGGLYKDQGTFAQYLRIPYGACWKPPPTISNADASTYGVSAVTAMLALYQTLSVPWPDASSETLEKRSILIYAGSSCAGLYALQMARKAGLTTITTCSPRNFELVKSFGADAAFDYRSPTLVEDITVQYPDVTMALDCFCEGHSPLTCANVIAKNTSQGGKGKVVSLLAKGAPLNYFRWPKTVDFKAIIAYTLAGRPFQMLAPLGPKWPAIPEDRAALDRFYRILPGLLEWLKPCPVEVLEGGFDALLPGENRLKKGDVSGKKLVVQLA